jgi:hypothetical protein
MPYFEVILCGMWNTNMMTVRNLYLVSGLTTGVKSGYEMWTVSSYERICKFRMIYVCVLKALRQGWAKPAQRHISGLQQNIKLFYFFVRFEVFTAVTMKNAVFWYVAPCSSCVNRRFGGTYRLNLQSRKIRERGTSVSRWLQTNG